MSQSSSRTCYVERHLWADDHAVQLGGHFKQAECTLRAGSKAGQSQMLSWYVIHTTL